VRFGMSLRGVLSHLRRRKFEEETTERERERERTLGSPRVHLLEETRRARTEQPRKGSSDGLVILIGGGSGGFNGRNTRGEIIRLLEVSPGDSGGHSVPIDRVGVSRWSREAEVAREYVGFVTMAGPNLS